jgi:hypothetical protein
LGTGERAAYKKRGKDGQLKEGRMLEEHDAGSDFYQGK